MSDKIQNINSLTAFGSTSELQRIREFVLLGAKSFGFDEINSNKIALAVDEACSNIIKHSYNYDSDQKISIELDDETGKFLIRIQDNGKPFDPRIVNSPNMNDYFKKFRKGGLGIHIIKSVMDEINYIPSNKHRKTNTLELKKVK